MVLTCGSGVRGLLRRAQRRLKLWRMRDDLNILLLGGSFEARRAGEALARLKLRHEVIVSEEPRAREPVLYPPTLRRFASAQQMADFMRSARINVVLDASHTFDRCVTEQGFAAAGALGLPYLRLERPAWDTNVHARWHRAANVAAAQLMIGPRARVFCATGWDSLAGYAGFRGEVLMLRQTRRHDRLVPYDFLELVFGDPPFSAAQEEALFRARRVDLLICRNLGGQASRPKLDAALALDIDVILIDRPPAPAGLPVVSDIATALAWLATL